MNSFITIDEDDVQTIFVSPASENRFCRKIIAALPTENLKVCPSLPLPRRFYFRFHILRPLAIILSEDISNFCDFSYFSEFRVGFAVSPGRVNSVRFSVEEEAVRSAI